MTDLNALNAARWKVMKVCEALTSHIDQIASRLVAPQAKSRYDFVGERTSVPWYVIAVIHERESSQSWLANLAQGDPWTKCSVHVPRGRGPFGSWESAACDALKSCPPYAAKWTDWSAGGALTLLERYNGLGYANGPYDRFHDKHYPPQASPYVWASTDQYVKGKYVSDGHFDPDAIDRQIGCAALLSRMIVLDSSIVMVTE